MEITWKFQFDKQCISRLELESPGYGTYLVDTWQSVYYKEALFYANICEKAYCVFFYSAGIWERDLNGLRSLRLVL
jgi:hypothetical protein